MVITMPYVQTEDGDTRFYYQSFYKPGFEVTKISETEFKKVVKFTNNVRKAKKIKPKIRTGI